MTRAMIPALTRFTRRRSRRAATFAARCSSVLALLAACAAPPPPPDTPETRAQQARAAQAELLRQSQEYASTGDWIRAEQYVALALEQGADSARVTRLLVDACVRGQRYRAAAFHAERGLLRHPDDAQLRLVHALLLLGLDDPASASSELEQLLAMEPDHALAHFVLGSLQREHLRDPVGADRHFRAYLAIAPRGAYAERARRGVLVHVPLADAARAPEPPAMPVAMPVASVESASNMALPRALPAASDPIDPASTAPENAP